MLGQYIQIASGIFLGISILGIIYAGFRYATSQGDPRETEQAKSLILLTGMGLFISMTGMVIGSIFNEVPPSPPVTPTHSDNEGSFHFFYFLLGAFIVIPLAHFITGKIAKRKHKKANISSVPISNSLTLEKEEPINHTIDESMQTFFSSIFSTINSLEKEYINGNIEQKHILRNLKQDTERLLHSFTTLPNQKKISYTPKVKERLQKIEHTLQVLQENLETNNIHQVEKMLLLIDERYQHEKSQ